MGVVDNGTILVQVDFEVFGKVQGKQKRNYSQKKKFVRDFIN